MPFAFHAPSGVLPARSAGRAPSAQQKPKVRTITAFIRLDPAGYKQQSPTRSPCCATRKARYRVGGLPGRDGSHSHAALPRIHRRNGQAGRLAFFQDLDTLAKKENVLVGIGPALTTENDDPARGATPRRNSQPDHQYSGSVVVAGKRRCPLEGACTRRPASSNIWRITPTRASAIFVSRHRQRSGVHAVFSGRLSPGPGTSIRHRPRIGQRRRRCDGREARSGGNTPGAHRRMGMHARACEISPARSISRPDGRTWASIFRPRQ